MSGSMMKAEGVPLTMMKMTRMKMRTTPTDALWHLLIASATLRARGGVCLLFMFVWDWAHLSLSFCLTASPEKFLSSFCLCLCACFSLDRFDPTAVPAWLEPVEQNEGVKDPV